MSRIRRDAPPQLLGRGQRNSSVGLGLRSASIVGESAITQPAEPPPYVITDEYILKKYRGCPPSLIIHLHPTHFRFDQQEGSFSYKSPMRMVIEHLRQRTVPHDLLEFMQEVQFYDGCMIVQIHDHKSIAPSQGPNRVAAGSSKTVPFSVHNYNNYLTPSSYVPYPTSNTSNAKGKEGEVDEKSKTTEQKDKENMPAPTLPGDSRNKSNNPPKKPKIITVVLHPTPLSNHVDLGIKASEARNSPEDRRGSRQEANGGPLSATVPPTPTTAAPPTPQLNMAPPAKRVKKAKADLDVTNIYAVESQITIARTADLRLEPVANAAEAAALLESLAHPMHSEKPPAPKTRKRTVAEMAADEAQAADQERFMLVLDERLSSNASGAPGGANPANGDGPAGGASFEPRFERFKALENIKANHEENKRQEKLRQEEAARKQRVEQERNKLEENNKRAAEEKNRANSIQQQAQQAQQAHQQQQLQQEAQRRRQAQQAHQGIQGVQGAPTQIPVPHAHPQTNGIATNGMNSQPQRFHQQVSQAQTSSPIVRNGTPQSHSSPTVNNMGNAPMQHSTSSMGGSPPRPGSVVHQNHHPMGAQAAQGMATQRSQQSHAGTPRMPNSTPIVQTTPLNRQMSQTPRLSQGSPLQGPMGQTPQVQMMNNGGQPMQMNAQQIQVLRNQQMAQMLQRQAAAQGMAGVMGQGGNPMNQQQQQLLAAQAQAQAIRAQQLGQQGNPITQQYAAQLAQMGRATAGIPQNMNQNFMNGNPAMGNPQMSLQQMQQMQRMQLMQQQQAQAAQQQQMQQQQQQQQQHPDQQNLMQQQLMQRQINALANQIYMGQRQNMIAQQYPGGLPPEVDAALRQRCSQHARQQWEANMRARQQMAAAQRMNGMQNGM